MKPAEIFTNQFGRLRSGWRFSVFIAALILLTFALVGAVGAILVNLPVGVSKGGLLDILTPHFVLLTLAIFLGWLCGKFLEGLPFRALGAWFTKNWLKDFIWGLLLGAVSIGLAALILVGFGATSFQLNQAAGQSAILLTLAVSFGVFAVGALAEEAFFRGYIFQTFTRAKLVLFAVALTSLLFAYTHTSNQGANYLSFINTTLAGVWFGAAYLKTRTLWLAFGLHLAWNWMQGAVLGISVSGITSITTAPLLQPTNSGSTILTGGDYGIEGGIACTIALIISTLLIWFAPIFKPTEEMLNLTSEEDGKQ
ncbi:MAG: CPBP family intramembrane metalloprotease [Pyrinomonadaceae bacterium]|nr:CPBP family intramembrane metalloprotease [Pyrinomonadaceae bacterium]